MRPVILLLLALGLMACSSQPQQNVNYYMLYTPSQLAATDISNAKSKKVWLNKILLADYLKQSSLTMQVNQNKMHFSRQDVWAESLESSVFKALLADLNKDKARRFIGDMGPNTDKKNTELSVQFDYFHATDQSTVIVSGRYWINVPMKDESIEIPFFLSLPLHEDGYSHSVSQQRELLRLLALQIQKELASFDL